MCIYLRISQLATSNLELRPLPQWTSWLRRLQPFGQATSSHLHQSIRFLFCFEYWNKILSHNLWRPIYIWNIPFLNESIDLFCKFFQIIMHFKWHYRIWWWFTSDVNNSTSIWHFVLISVLGIVIIINGMNQTEIENKSVH